MTRSKLSSMLLKSNANCGLIKDFEFALIGISNDFQADPKPAYDLNAIMYKYTKEGFTMEAASDFLTNKLGKLAKEDYPVFIHLVELEESAEDITNKFLAVEATIPDEK